MENVRTLLALGAATIGDEDEHETSILGTAVSVLSLESLEIILRHGVNPNRCHPDGRIIPLKLAGDGHPERSVHCILVYQLMLRYRAPVHPQDEDGDTALYLLAKYSSKNEAWNMKWQNSS